MVCASCSPHDKNLPHNSCRVGITTSTYVGAGEGGAVYGGRGWRGGAEVLLLPGGVKTQSVGVGGYGMIDFWLCYVTIFWIRKRRSFGFRGGFQLSYSRGRFFFLWADADY